MQLKTNANICISLLKTNINKQYELSSFHTYNNQIQNYTIKVMIQQQQQQYSRIVSCTDVAL